MFKRAFYLAKTPLLALSHRTPKLPIMKTLPMMSLNTNFSQRFSSTPTNVFTEHEKEIRLLQYYSTRMPEPDEIRKVDNKDWERKGYLSLMKEYSQHLEIYEADDIPIIPGISTPATSWVRFKFPISKNTEMRDTLQRFFTGLRIGKIVEIMDYVAVTAAYKFAKQEPSQKTALMATASMNDMEIFESQIDSSKDLYLTAYACYVGKTSMEIRVDVSHSEEPKDLIAAAYSMFVSRDAQDYSKAYVLPDLSFEGENDEAKCILRQEYGKRNKQRRIEFAANSAFKVPPSSEESIELHGLFRKSMHAKKSYIPIDKTQREKLVLTHVQDKNAHGMVFGGYVMKEALELAWSVSYLNGDGTNPLYLKIDDVTFLRPIKIGSIVNFKACVAYIKGNLINVQVVADIVKNNQDSEEDEEERVFEVHVTFNVQNEIKPVIPVTYNHGMLYLEGKRRVTNLSSL